MRELVRSDRILTVPMTAEELGMDRESVQTLAQELGMRTVYAKMVPKLLTDGQKEHRINVCRELGTGTIGDNPQFLGQVITGDETWVFQCSVTLNM